MFLTYGKDFNWFKNKLFDRETNSKTIEIIKEKRFPGMFRIKWSNGDLSRDFYNLTRAKDNAVKYTLHHENKHRKKPF